jgi:hypothetical protein
MRSTYETTPQGRAIGKYRDRLATLGAMVGQRNGRLLGVTTLGILAGLPDDRILAEVRMASGNPPLSDAEIKRALETARQDTRPLTDRQDTARRWMPPTRKPPPLGSGAISFVRRMIAKGNGATCETLADSSPVAIPTDPREQTQLFLRSLWQPSDMLFIGRRYDAGKIGLTIEKRSEWEHLYRPNGIDPGELVCANPLSGREGRAKDGTASYRCSECVADRRYALVEYDAMPILEQCAFWAGVISTRTLPLRSLTFSGSKSIHALVEVGAEDPEAWKLATNTLFYAVAHPDAPQGQRADRACMTAERLTRLAGARRDDNCKIQTFLWLDGRS